MVKKEERQTVRKFYLRALVNSPDVGEVLAVLQERGCDVRGFNVLPEGATLPPDELVVDHAPTPEPPRAIAYPSKRASVKGGPTEAMRTYLNELQPGAKFTPEQVYEALIAHGYNAQSLRHAFRAIIKNKRYKRTARGSYVVIGAPEPAPKIGRPVTRGAAKPAHLRTASAFVYLRDHVAAMGAGKETSRKELMRLGEQAGFTAQNLNTAIQELYRHKLVIREGQGKYRVIGATDEQQVPYQPDHRVNFPPANGPGVFRSIVEE